MSYLKFEYGSDVVYKNYLISNLCKLNLDNGHIVFNKQVALNEGCLQHGVVINQQRGVFYVEDRKFVNCFKLPNEIL